jgi:membrane protease YdiL (CAAX protease family)
MGPVVITILLFIPFIMVLWLANVAERQRTEGKPTGAAAVLCYAILLALLGLLIFVGVVIQVIGVMAPSALVTAPGSDSQLISPKVMAAMPRMGLGLWLPSLLGLLLLLPPLRGPIARLIPIDPANVLHTASLTYGMLILAQMLATMGFGLGNAASLLGSGNPATDARALVPTFWAQEITWLFMAMVGVGLLSRRNIAQVLARLGVVLPSWRQSALGLVVGAGMAALVFVAVYAADALGVGVDKSVEKLTELLIGPMTRSALGIVTLGLAAALGEEAIFRGALQPRFGLPLTAVLFTLLHAQYGLSLATVMILGVGLILGWLRRRHNTSTTMIAHAAYNITAGLIALL